MAASRSISPKPLIPISKTKKSSEFSARNKETGNPIWLFKLPSVFFPLYLVDNSWYIISFTVVFPLLPVIPIIFKSNIFLQFSANFCKNLILSFTKNAFG